MGLTSAIITTPKASIFQAGLGAGGVIQPTEHDKRWILYTYSRLPGNRTPDTDYYIYNSSLSLPLVKGDVAIATEGFVITLIEIAISKISITFVF